MGDLRLVNEDEHLGLVRRAQGGDRSAFEALYRAAVGRVYAVCLRMTGNRTSAEELTQEAFVRAWRKLGTFRGEAAFTTWMHRLAVNVVLGARRSGSRRPEVSSEDEPAVAERSAPPIASVEAIDLERAIAGLPTRARQVFVLHEIEGYRHDEIAELAGMAVGTSKAHLNRARRLLREALTP